MRSMPVFNVHGRALLARSHCSVQIPVNLFRAALPTRSRRRLSKLRTPLPFRASGVTRGSTHTCRAWPIAHAAAAVQATPAAVMYFLLAPALLYSCFKIVQMLIRADADFNLLSKGAVKPGTFEGKVVWITGASQGLGESLAIYLSSLGARLILSSRRTEALEAVRAKCQSSPEDIVILPFDLCGPNDELQQAALAAQEAFNGRGVDYLIHNAGASQHALAEETTAEVTRKLFDLNTLGPINLTRAALPGILAKGKGGRIVVVGSMASKVPSPGQAVYSGCKMALYGYFATLATELVDRGIGVTICCPGPINSGSDDKPRVVYGPTGQIVHNATSAAAKSKVALQRCTELVVRAAAHGVDECWIARHPVLLMGYITQYLPWLSWIILKKVGPKRAKAVSSGKSGYDVAAIMRSSTEQPSTPQ